MVTISAKTTMLVNLTATSYAKSEHGDNYLADKYVGTVSIRGADRFLMGNAAYYPKWISITYDVQGVKHKKQVNSNGKSDTATIKKTMTVKDEWNNGSKTQVYGKYDKGFIMNVTINSLNNTK